MCLKELYKSKYDPLSVSYTVLSGKDGFIELSVLLITHN